MKRLFRPFSLFIMAFFALTQSSACAGSGGEGTVPMSAGDLTGGYNQFGIGLFTREAATAGNGNVFVSPVSVALCLGMAYNGAGGSTATEMAALLGAGSISLDEFDEANGTLAGRLSDTGAGVTLSIANSIWLRKGFPIRKEFISRNGKYFRAGAFELETAREINRWVEKKTSGLIPSIIDSVDPADIAILVNAIYFKGEWTVEFDEKNTEDAPFHSPEGEIKVPMMRRSGKLECHENDLFQSVRLTYGNGDPEAGRAGGGTSMYVLLPAGGKTLNDLKSQLTPENWKTWTSSLARREGTIELPRFRAEYFSRLNGTLIGMGMKEAFGRRADFTGLCECAPGAVYISDVFHKAVIEVNEKGTEAAAATSITLKLTSAMPVEEPFHMKVDRPFLVAIVDDETGLILFMGAISDPQRIQ
jgi:serine protease inhibitor